MSYNSGGLNALIAPGTNFFDQTAAAQRRVQLEQSNYDTRIAQNQAAKAAALQSISKASEKTDGVIGGNRSTSGTSTYTSPSYSTAPSYTAPSYSQPSYESPQNSAPAYTPPTYSNLQTNPPNSTIDAGVPQNFNTAGSFVGFNGSSGLPSGLNTSFRPPQDSGVNSASNTSSNNSVSNYNPNAAVGTTSLNTSFGNDNGGLTDVFTKLADLNNTQANQNQRRFNEDLNTQSQVYQDFDNVAAERTSKINKGARQQGYELSSLLSAQGSKQNMAEETNRGQVQANTTNTIRNSDMQRALSILPMRK
jgi:hypothetical protein